VDLVNLYKEVEEKCINKNPTESGKTTLELARKAGNKELAEYLSNK